MHTRMHEATFKLCVVHRHHSHEVILLHMELLILPVCVSYVLCKVFGC